MFPTIVAILVTASAGGDGSARADVQLLVDTIESLQQPVEDFQCEFEGTRRFKGKVAEGQKLGEDGLDDSFSGIFIWKKGGDTRSDVLHRRGSDDLIARETLVVRMREQQAEKYYRLNDAPLGYAVIENPKKANSWSSASLGFIFLIDKIKRDVSDPNAEPSVSEDQFEGRPLKVLSITLKNFPDTLMHRYWIDLRRNGHVVRHEVYVRGRVMGARLDIKLAPFKVGDSEVWMPVSGDYSGYGANEKGKPIIVNDPTVLQKIYVVGGTMEFNKRPSSEVFTMKYKPGTPVSDNLRKLTYEFGQQKTSPRVTRTEAEKLLKEQVAKAETQRSELVALSPSEGFNWTPWLACGFGVLALISSITLWIQSRRN
jgi:hypothetical protein